MTIKIGIFEDTNGKRHALPIDTYKAFKKSCFWHYKHVAYTERTDLDARQVKALTEVAAKVAKIGMFDLVINNWTLQGDIALTDKQATQQKVALAKQAKKLNSWERSMKRMDMLPSAAGAILAHLSDRG